ncbi:Glucan_synthase domain-containing protein/FKS1_dom1 domain-containing protein [Cephalotus follicularis]|uniref:1,3-beta-glucan synthase n=1 Tax=Cephalotus follicularis TaxID=3775 RepID=A0A1Q3CKU9_CEPFO|nr:Glucan_synthase domain-containing protein/FKS1_dom1 domain-containing protein [Cephalotus follicularis]
MARVQSNWERLVRATLKREQLRNAGQGHERTPSGIAGAVPPSLDSSTNIDAILQAADEIQSEDPNVARILCEQAYTMAQNLDPNSDGRGVLQFKTGLMSVIKQKLAKRDGDRIDRNRDIERLWEFYQQYKRRHRVDDIQREEERWRESGSFSPTMGEWKLKSLEMKKVLATLTALVEVMEALSKDADSAGVGRLIMEELRRIKKADGELTPYNIIPLEAPSLTNAIGVFPEVRAAIYAIRYTEHFPKLPADFEISGQREADMFDLLEYVFGFQKDNIRNQRENVVLAVANSQSRAGIPVQTDPKVDEKTINEVFLKVLANYIKWCKYLRIRLVWNSLEAINRDRKLFLVSLYFLIWGEAANVRFLPECICYIFHNMAKELDAILDHGEANPAASCITENGSVSFLDRVICPIYETIAAEAARNDGGKAAHSKWRNYDDFNEYFWSPACFELNWPMRSESPFLFKPKKRKRTGKSSFVEHRTFLHLYRSFHRLWMFLILMFQALTIIAFKKGRINLDTVKILLSIGPAFAIMNFIESCLDILLMFGAYTTARGMAISRLFIQFFWCGLSSVFITYIYVKVLQENNQQNSESLYFRIYILVVGVYAAVRIVFALLLKIPACHSLSEMSDQSFFQFFKWIYQERYFVGRGLFERIGDYCRYVLFWLVIFICKFTFAYFLQIQPLVEPTNIIIGIRFSQYSWHDFVSKNNHNALTLAALWAPVVAIYIMDIYIWYTLLSSIVGGVMGARARLGEIRSIEMVHKRYESFPEAFVKNLVSPHGKREPFNRESSQVSQDMNKTFAAMFSPFWNEIIKSLREEDYISNREMDLLSIPSNTGSLRLVQWPLFLLSSKILLAVDLALDCKDTQADLWSRICRDEYMAYAVQECYYSIEKILHSLVDGEGRLWVERIFREINNSILEGSLVITLFLKKLPVVLSRFTALTGLLIRNETAELAKGAAKAVYELYEVVTHELLSSDLREQLDTWNILARARNEGRLFSSIEWPKDQEIKEQLKRLHLLLTVKDSAANIPKNLEARRRLEFFTNSLFMDMPSAKPVSEMMPFCVFTPYYSETVLYSSSELRAENEDGISILFYLQKIFPDEWENFLERIGRGETTGDIDLQESSSDTLELRFWVSYRGQTLARTVRGMMYYRRALMLQSHLERRPFGAAVYSQTNFPSSQGFEVSREARAQADLKFTYVISCQIYGQQKQRKAPEAADIALLLQRNEALRVAFIHVEDSGADGKVSKFFSKLVKADIHGKDQEIYSVRLPGDPKLGEGKPENQNHAIIFTRGEAIQTIDMNQDNYLEEAMKMRNLLEEFRGNHGIRPPTILGVREHVFTGSVSSLAWFMSNQETSFVTLGQRVLAWPLKVRMHYGHPDVFDRIFHITRGGISKASRVINISEDIFAGFNSTLRQGNITHHEYIQVGKGRDVGLNQIALFEGKVAGGNGEQVLSRDVYRLGQLFDFFRMLSFYFTTVGFYVCTMMTVLTVYIFLYGRVYLAFSGLDRAISREAKMLGNTALDAALNAQFLVQIGVFTAVPMIMGFILELGLLKAVFSFITMQLQLCSVFFTFSLGTRTHYFGRTILHGGAKYRATGRGFVVRHIKFAENYRLYSRSHFVKALEVALLLIVYIAYGYSDGGAVSFILLTVSSWFLVISWLFAPYIFNPSGFEWQKTVEDFDDWTSWLLYKGGVGVKGDNSWESWWDEEQMHIQTLRGRILETILSLRFFLFQYGVVYKLHLTGGDVSLAVYGFSWVVLVGIVLIFKVFSYSPKKSTNFQLLMRFMQGVTSLALVAALCLVVAFTDLSISDLFASILAFVPTGWAILCLAVTWKKVVRYLGLWDSIREFARMYDAGMGVIIFVPIVMLSWFPFISTFQSRLLFNQAFSRGLEISIILAGNKANVDV